jgi:amidohydrolase
MKLFFSLVFTSVCILNIYSQKNLLNNEILKSADQLSNKYQELYFYLHQNPELSLMETKTSGLMADNLRKLGFETTTGLGGNGVVGIFRNGKGKTIMLRTDMDALPVKENTGLPYASNIVMKDSRGIEYPVMHACGHDIHMTTWLGTLNTLVALKDRWHGTLIAVGQPAEEGMYGAQAMIDAGLFKIFPVPDYALCYHVSPDMPAGTIGFYPGPIFAGTKPAEVTVYGLGGHGATPHKTIDPVVIAARIIVDLQTIVSRTINPLKPAVVTVGSIHGGTRGNIIPEEVKMQLSIRFYENDVLETIKESVIRICRGAAISAGLPEEKMPLVVFDKSNDGPVVNDPLLVMNGVTSMKEILGDANVIRVDPALVAEDFAKYGQTDEKIPIALFWLGGVAHEKYDSFLKNGTILSPLHSSTFAPDFTVTFRTGVSAMARNVIDLFRTENNH